MEFRLSPSGLCRAIVPAHSRTIFYDRRPSCFWDYRLKLPAAQVHVDPVRPCGLKPYFVRFGELHFFIDFTREVYVERNVVNTLSIKVYLLEKSGDFYYVPLLHNLTRKGWCHLAQDRTCANINEPIVPKLVDMFFKTTFNTSPYLTWRQHEKFEKNLEKGIVGRWHKAEPGWPKR